MKGPYRLNTLSKTLHITDCCKNSKGKNNQVSNSENSVDSTNNNLTEDEFLHAIFAYLNTLQDISAQFIDRMSLVIEDKL